MSEVVKQIAAETVEQKLTSYADSLAQGINLVTQKLVAVAPEATHLVLKALQINATISIFIGCLSLIPLYPLYHLFKWGQKECKDENNRYSCHPELTLIGVSVTAIGFVIVFGIHTLAPDVLMSAVFPEGYLALEALHKAGIQ